MIIDESSVGRYSFYLDINDGTPFRPERYVPNHYEFHYKPIRRFVLEQCGRSTVKRFDPIRQWLEPQTHAFRVNAVTLADDTCVHCPEIQAIRVEVPVDLAVLFRLYWYDG